MFRSLVLTAFVLPLAFSLCAAPQRAHAEPWLIGTKFQKQLKQPIGLSWKDVPLRQALGALSSDQRIAIYLDRRVDPSKPVTLAFDGQPLADACRLIAKNQELGVCLIGDVIYFGLPADVDRLRTVAAMRQKEARRQPATARGRLLAKKSIHWENLASPADVLSELAKRGGVRIVNIARLPHDLWPAADLPPLAWIDRLSIIAAQFDYTIKFSPDGTAVALMPIPSDLAIDNRAGRLPKVSPPSTEGGHQIYTLTIKNQPVGKLLTALAKQLDVEVTVDKVAINSAGKSLETLVSFEVRGVKLDALLRAATAPAGLTFRRKGKHVTILPE